MSQTNINALELADRLHAARDRVEALNAAIGFHHHDLGRVVSGMQLLCSDVTTELDAIAEVLHPERQEDA